MEDMIMRRVFAQGGFADNPWTPESLRSHLSGWDWGWYPNCDPRGLDALPADQFQDQDVCVFEVKLPSGDDYEEVLLADINIMEMYQERNLVPADPYTLARTIMAYGYFGHIPMTVWTDKHGRTWRMELSRGWHEGGPWPYANVTLTPKWTRRILGATSAFVGIPTTQFAMSLEETIRRQSEAKKVKLLSNGRIVLIKDPKGYYGNIANNVIRRGIPAAILSGPVRNEGVSNLALIMAFDSARAGLPELRTLITRVGEGKDWTIFDGRVHVLYHRSEKRSKVKPRELVEIAASLLDQKT